MSPEDAWKWEGKIRTSIGYGSEPLFCNELTSASDAQVREQVINKTIAI
jgi:hypothetical protein